MSCGDTAPANRDCRRYLIPAAPTKAEVLASFARVLGFPPYFGNNYDALADCLGDFAAGLEEPTMLVWQVRPAFARQPGFGVVRDILRTSEQLAPRTAGTQSLLAVVIEEKP